MISVLSCANSALIARRLPSESGLHRRVLMKPRRPPHSLSPTQLALSLHPTPIATLPAKHRDSVVALLARLLLEAAPRQPESEGADAG
jgi:hypothetical protein